MTTTTLNPATLFVLEQLRKKRRWTTSVQLGLNLTLDELRLMGYTFHYSEWKPSKSPNPSMKNEEVWKRLTEGRFNFGTEYRIAEARRLVAGRIAGRLRRLREHGLVEQRIVILETKTGGLQPVCEWRAIPKSRLRST